MNLAGLVNQQSLYPVTFKSLFSVRQGPQVRANEKNITKNEGQSADLVCLVENVQNAVTWKWIFQGTLITVPDDARLVFTSYF